jgi:putative ABC transport system ATP-binding protein
MSAAPLLEARAVSRHYDDGRVRAVDGVTLAVSRGETMAIMGPSGCGKSTLLHLLCGLEPPTAGRVLIDGEGVSSGPAWAGIRARRIGIVFQSFNLLPMLTACENVEVPMMGVVRGASARRARALRLLQQVGLADRVSHRPPRLSGGERQRVAIARSLANDPDVLLADEPTGNLDSHAATDILRQLFDLRRDRGLALVLVTHDRNVADMAGRLVTMKDGRL